MLSDTDYTILSVWLFKNDEFAILLVIKAPHNILHLQMELGSLLYMGVGF